MAIVLCLLVLLSGLSTMGFVLAMIYIVELSIRASPWKKDQ